MPFRLFRKRNNLQDQEQNPRNNIISTTTKKNKSKTFTSNNNRHKKTPFFSHRTADNNIEEHNHITKNCDSYSSGFSSSMSVEPRKYEELEGSLLPPTAPSMSIESAVAVPHESTNNEATIVTSAVPVDYFDYDNRTNDPQNPIPEDSTALPPIAPALLNYDQALTPEDHERQVSHATKYASDLGRIRSSDERESVERANRETASIQYFDKQRMEAAKAIAKQRKREGFDPQTYHRAESITDVNGNENAPFAGDGDKKGAVGRKGDYEVDDYDVSEYDGSTYESSYEYKSVYD